MSVQCYDGAARVVTVTLAAYLQAALRSVEYNVFCLSI